MQNHPPPIDVIEWGLNAFFTCVAAVGGFLGHVSRQIARGEPVRLITALVEAMGSAFVGFIALLICKAMGLDYNWTGAVVGLLGWLGSSASAGLLERVVRKQFGV